MSERLFRAGYHTTDRMRKRHYSHHARYLRAWVSHTTWEFLWDSEDSLMTLRVLKAPHLYPELQVSDKEHFFDDSEHWAITLCYHVNDIKLLERRGSGETICEVCKVADAVLIDDITDIETMAKTELMMCEDCFDQQADMGSPD